MSYLLTNSLKDRAYEELLSSDVSGGGYSTRFRYKIYKTRLMISESELCEDPTELNHTQRDFTPMRNREQSASM